MLKRQTNRPDFLAENYDRIHHYYSYVIFQGIAVVKRMHVKSGRGVEARGACVRTWNVSKISVTIQREVYT